MPELHTSAPSNHCTIKYCIINILQLGSVFTLSVTSEYVTNSYCHESLLEEPCSKLLCTGMTYVTMTQHRTHDV